MIELKLSEMHIKYFWKIADEIIQHEEYQKLKNFIQHGKITCYDHSLSVAMRSYKLAIERNKKVNLDSLIRGALLHDFFLYDWHSLSGRKRFHGFRHPKIAYQKAVEVFNINNIEKDVIISHMWPLTFFNFPKTSEAVIVLCSDKICSLQETLRLKRRTYFE